VDVLCGVSYITIIIPCDYSYFHEGKIRIDMEILALFILIERYIQERIFIV